eukprot:gnl/TRDRNA2_/TRDRNA2_62479_c0_seq2.p1 gnl/TRDRNA2_/TRDRNA2_62479_c0~~gnl/TRDRNA2_/TRDRNA2_62479_c0_seq2.p1  ORF type:complete len:462 (+),score=120.37 gnl/TRDRNA2_/TRDRNA2_62479_c0_seq2:76-1386(+)
MAGEEDAGEVAAACPEDDGAFCWPGRGSVSQEEHEEDSTDEDVDAAKVRFQIEDEVLTMRLDWENMTPHDVITIWEWQWGVKYASRIKFAAPPDSPARYLNPRSDFVPACPAVTRLVCPPALQGTVLAAVARAIKRHCPEAEEVAEAARRKQREAERRRQAKEDEVARVSSMSPADEEALAASLRRRAAMLAAAEAAMLADEDGAAQLWEKGSMRSAAGPPQASQPAPVASQKPVQRSPPRGPVGSHDAEASRRRNEERQRRQEENRKRREHYLNKNPEVREQEQRQDEQQRRQERADDWDADQHRFEEQEQLRREREERERQQAEEEERMEALQDDLPRSRTAAPPVEPWVKRAAGLGPPMQAKYDPNLRRLYGLGFKKEDLRSADPGLVRFDVALQGEQGRAQEIARREIQERRRELAIAAAASGPPQRKADGS